MDKQVVQKRLMNESEFVSKFGVDEILEPDWAWTIIAGMGTREAR